MPCITQKHLSKKPSFPIHLCWSKISMSGISTPACLSSCLNSTTCRHSNWIALSYGNQEGLSGLMLRHALFSVSSGIPSLTVVDYGSNVLSVSAAEGNSKALPVLYNGGRFTAWFYLPSLLSLVIWLPTRRMCLCRSGKRKTNLKQLQTLAIARVTIGE